VSPESSKISRVGDERGEVLNTIWHSMICKYLSSTSIEGFAILPGYYCSPCFKILDVQCVISVDDAASLYTTLLAQSSVGNAYTWAYSIHSTSAVPAAAAHKPSTIARSESEEDANVESPIFSIVCTPYKVRHPGTTSM
jgi:hypothetical protein